MAIQLLDSAGTNKAIIDASGGIRVVPSPPDIGANGAYRLCAYTGALATIAAGTASAGHIFAARWTHATKLALVTHFRARWLTIAGPTAAQEFGLDAFIARNYTVNHGAGTAVTLTGDAMKKRATHGTTTFADIRISATAALTGSSFTLDPSPFAAGFGKEMATGATVPTTSFEALFAVNDQSNHPIVLRQNEGIVLRNVVLMGAGGTARVTVEMDWLEVDSY